MGQMRRLLPIACTLVGEAANDRWVEWQGLLSGGSAHKTDGQLTVAFPRSFVSADRLRALVAAERQCCGFVDWNLEERGTDLVITVRGEPDGLRAIAESFGL
jgi:hypothetical protein